MKVPVYDLEGKESGAVDLPRVFSTKVREDLIVRAFLSTMSKRRQAYGTDPRAGQKSSAGYHGRRRRVRWTMMGREMARMPRLHGKIPGYLMYRARTAPQTVKGRTAHPPKTEKIWTQKMNKKERQLAIKSAIAATADKKFVAGRGHKVKTIKELPIVVVDAVEEIKKTKDLKKALEAVGLKDEMKRIETKKVRAGKGTMRGRRYKRKTGPLIVVTNDKGVSKAANNISGVNIITARNLSVEYLAPGAAVGRLTVFTKGAIEKLGSKQKTVKKDG
jgi:large subunit ribosomal protein L4e